MLTILANEFSFEMYPTSRHRYMLGMCKNLSDNRQFTHVIFTNSDKKIPSAAVSNFISLLLSPTNVFGNVCACVCESLFRSDDDTSREDLPA